MVSSEYKPVDFLPQKLNDKNELSKTGERKVENVSKIIRRKL